MPTKTDAIEFITHKINTDRAWAKKAFASLILKANKGNRRFLDAVNDWKSNPPTTTPAQVPKSNEPELMEFTGEEFD